MNGYTRVVTTLCALGLAVCPLMTYSFSDYYPTVHDHKQISILQEKLETIITNNTTQAETIRKKLHYLQTHKTITQNPKNKRYIDQLTNIVDKALHREFLKRFDYESDHSITKFVTQSRGFSQKTYTPNDIIVLTPNNYLVLTQRHDGIPYQLREVAQKQLYSLAEAYYKEFSHPLTLTSAYRSYDEQVAIYKHCSVPDGCAKPGHSEHQTGLAVDIGMLQGEKFERMRNSAHKYGYHQSYQGGTMHNEYAEEHWHWRYVGPALATFLHDNAMTFSQRYYYNNF